MEGEGALNAEFGVRSAEQGKVNHEIRETREREGADSDAERTGRDVT